LTAGAYRFHDRYARGGESAAFPDKWRQPTGCRTRLDWGALGL